MFRSSKRLQKILKGFKCFKRFQKVPKGSKRFQMVPKGFKRLQTESKKSQKWQWKLFIELLNTLKIIRSPKIVIFFILPKNVSNWSKKRINHKSGLKYYCCCWHHIEFRLHRSSIIGSVNHCTVKHAEYEKAIWLSIPWNGPKYEWLQSVLSLVCRGTVTFNAHLIFAW